MHKKFWALRVIFTAKGTLVLKLQINHTKYLHLIVIEFSKNIYKKNVYNAGRILFENID